MITLTHVTKYYPVRGGLRRILDKVSLKIGLGDAIGIMGCNGAGKSTLSRIISGAERPSSGHVERNMSVSWPLGYAGAFQSSLTGADNVRYIARIYGAPVDDTLEYVEDFAELGRYMRMPVRTYSSGMQARLAFGLSLAISFDCYVIDEIVSVGDHRFSVRCERALKEKLRDGALVMISHDIETIRRYCNIAALLKDGQLTIFNSADELELAYRSD